jgi:hypothetical protein
VKGKIEVLMRESQYDRDGVSRLFVFNGDPAFTDLVILGGYVGLNSVFVPGIYGDAGIGGFHL